MTLLSVLCGLLIAPFAAAAFTATDVPPPAPKAPEWIEPAPLSVTTIVHVKGCDDGPADKSTVGHFTTQEYAPGIIAIKGWIDHGGSEQLDPDQTLAWRVGERVVVAYQFRSNPYPEAPILMCPAYSLVEFQISINGTPTAIEMHAGRLSYTHAGTVILRTP